MKRIMILVATMAVAAAACTSGSASDSATPAPAAATPAPAEVTEPATAAAPAATEQPEATATMSWDGTTCTYAGPTVVPRGARLTVALTNTPESASGGRDGAAFILVKVDDNITKEDFDAYKASHEPSDTPPWVDDAGGLIVYPDQVKDGLPLIARGLTANRFMILCGESPKDGQEMHFGSIIETKGS
jgi:pyruvate/2-oxoglutarate dehydrogenase complex dihydrolipoamide acyltransferase (E2) component